MHCHVAYNDTTPNVVWSELQARKSGASVVVRRLSQPHHALGSDPRDRGGEAGARRARPTTSTTSTTGSERARSPGFNTLSVDWPQVGFSADGSETYVAWLRFVDAEVDPTADAGLPGIVTGMGFGDIAASLTRAGQPWSAPQNLTNTPQTDERFFSLAARNPLRPGAPRVSSPRRPTRRGSPIIGDRGTAPGNLLRRIAYLERPHDRQRW